MLRNILLLTIFICSLFSSQSLLSQCEISEPYSIVDFDTTYVQLIVEGASNNDLANNNALCAVTLNFNHEVIQDLQIRLISPSGQSVLLVGPINSGTNNTSISNWDISFVNEDVLTAAPDSGFDAQWSSNNEWAFFSNYTGSYYPFFGTLADFNLGSVDGTWTLEIIDGALFDEGNILEFSLIFCEGTVGTCDDCLPLAGIIDAAALSYCEGNPDLLIDFVPDYGTEMPPSTTSYAYLYVITENDIILDYANTPDLTTYPPGNYSVCGLSVIQSDVAEVAPVGSDISVLLSLINESTICAQSTTTCIDVEILELDNVVLLEETICQGDTLLVQGTPLFASGSYVVFNEDGTCNDATEVVLEVINVGAFINEPSGVLDCENPTIDLEGFNSIFSADTEVLWYPIVGGDIQSNPTNINITVGAGGTYVLQLTEGLCTSMDTIVVPPAVDQISVEIIGENITCISNNAFLQAQTSSVVNTYAWFFNDIQIGSTNSINTSGVGEYTIEITTADGCLATDSYEVIADTIVAPLVFDVLPLDCVNSAVTLNTTGTIGNSYTWSFGGLFYSSLEDPVVANPGVYDVAVLGLNGCLDTFDYEVLIDTITPTVMYEINPISCEQPITDIEAITSMDTDIIWSHDTEPSVNDNTLATSVPGTYYLEATALNGCIFRDTFEVAIDTIVPEFQVLDATIPCDTSGVQVTNNYNPLDGISFTWSTQSGDFSSVAEPIISSPGIYYVTAVAQNGCQVIDSITVNEAPGIPQFSLTADTLDCISTLATISTGLGAGYSFQWAGANGTTETTSSIEVSTIGSYTVTVTDDVTNCISIKSISVIEDVFIPPYTLTSTIIDCANGSATITYDDMGQDANILWAGTEVTIQSDTSFVTGVSGWYYLFGTATNGCEFTDSIEVVGDDDVPMLVFDPLIVDCNQDSFLLNYVSTVPLELYSWGGANGYESIQEFPMIPEAGTYVVNFVGVNGCSGSTSFTTQTDTITPSIFIQGDNTIDCIDNTALLTVDVGANATTYSWTGPNTSVTDIPNIEALDGGFYTVTAAADNGCVRKDSFEVLDQSNYPIIEIDYNDINCYASESVVTLSNDNPNASILWSSSNSIIDGTAVDNFITDIPTTYTVVVDAGVGCVSTESITINKDLGLPGIATTGFDTITCIERMVPLDIMVDLSLDSVRWTSQEGYTSDMLNPVVDAGGVYDVVVTATNGCTAIATYTVAVDTIPPIASSVVGGTLSCLQSKIDLDVDIDDDIASFYWEGPDNYSSLDSTPTVSVPGLYSLFQVADNGCISISQTDVIDNLSPPDINATDQNLPCNDSEIVLQANSTDENVVFNWFGPNFFSTEEFPLTNTPGEYIIIALGENGCIKNDTFQVTKIPVPPEYDVSVEPITCDNPLGMYTAIDTDDDESVSWLLPDNTTTNSTSVESALSGIFELIVISTNGCADTTLITSQFDTIVPVVMINTNEFIMCENREITLNSTGSSVGSEYTYTWSSDIGQGILGADNNVDCTIDVPATYQLSILNNLNGCENNAQIVVEEQANTFINLDLSSLDPSCYGTTDGEIAIDDLQGGLGDLSYSINGSSTITQSSFDNLSSGMYSFVVTDAFGCTIESSVDLIDPQEILIDIIPDTEIELGDSLLLQASVNIPDDRILNIEWVNEPATILCADCWTQYITPTQSTLYILELTDIDGCQATAQVFVEIDESKGAYVPNIFSPNNDGVNDRFELGFSKGVERVEEFHIVDRWGEKVFSIEDTSVPDESINWDATFKGDELNPGVFTYYLRFKMLSGSVRQRSGSLTVVK